MGKVPFLDPKFCGPRFESHGMPLEVLPELAAYRELVLAVAKELFRANNPEKKRLPKGFSQRLHLDLKQVKPGSAVPVVERLTATPMDLEVRDEFYEARDLIIRAVEDVAAGKPLPPEFPVGAIQAFGAMGRTLRDGEYVLLALPGSDTGPRFDKTIRGSLLLTRNTTYQDDVELTGELVAVDYLQKTITIRLQDSQTLTFTTPLSTEETKMASNSLPWFQPIAVRGLATFDSLRRLIRLDDAREAIILEASDALRLFNLSLDQLAGLPDDWFGTPGGAYNDAQLQVLKWTFYRLALEHGVPLPVLFPVEPGSVRAEWRPKPQDVSLEFTLDDCNAYLHSLNLETQEEHEREGLSLLNLDELGGILRELLPAEA